MKGVFTVFLLILLCAPAVFASTAFIEPVNISEGGSESMNLTIGNHNNVEKVVGVKLTTEQLEITDVTNLDEWKIDEDIFKITWSDGELKTNVVAAIFPFRVSVPFVDKDTATNITVLLTKETTTQEFTIPLLIKNNEAFDKSEVTLLSPKVLRRGRDYTIKAKVDPDHGLDVSASFLGNTYVLNKRNEVYEKTITLANTVEPRNYTLAFKVGDTKKETTIEVLKNLNIDLDVESAIAPGAAFKISGKLVPDDARQYKGYQVVFDWNSQRTTVSVKENQSFETSLIAPDAAGEYTVLVEFNDDGRTYTESKKLTVKKEEQPVVAEPEPEEAAPEPEKKNTATNNLVSGAIVAVPEPKTESKALIQDIEPRRVSSFFTGMKFGKYLTNGYVWLGLAFVLILVLASVFMHDHRPSAQPPQQQERREPKPPYTPESHPHRRKDDEVIDLFNLPEQEQKPKSNVKIISWKEHLKREQERILNEGRKE